jgi:hypothetical protein
MLTTKCVGALVLTETRDALHGGQIQETPSNWANQATSDPELERWTRVGFERGTRSRNSER